MAQQFEKFASMAVKAGGAGLAFAAIPGSAYVFWNACCFNVDAGHKAVVFNRFTGLKDKLYSEGTNIHMPWLEWPYIFNVRARPFTMPSLTGSKDLQMVNVTIRVLYRPQEQQLRTIYSTLGMNYDEKVMPSICNEILKSVIAQFNAGELLAQREAVSREVWMNLTRRAKDFNIEVDDVSITHLTFSSEYTAAVERKQVAQQQAKKAEYEVMRAKEEKKGTIIRAQAEAKATEMIGKAMHQDPAWLEMRRIEAAKKVAETLSKSTNRIVLSADSLLLNLYGDASDQSSKNMLKMVGK
mmetsp:Transcript_18221/g.40247  ORF Transcript_18221/g.40247 Transcript_18221/m.40247 type:complete len:297 (-) Transcript_18221:305-1195(-)|eukprot:CAMPEP_0204269014 /NCGR_PEP_ID=MMETSP0468-20130131/15534_1 /ASSEMBLY_ACC=CAM_ASM_000383 /TAXON_ID=2969 /ORGANISM="Oxyrrhis marina" /LENGTH=296 /DNA_ID=CAMNT_0051244349 /DNA_START=46 /DNA_END=936 /DNA_ORIENTATION=-